jgi:membrane protein
MLLNIITRRFVNGDVPLSATELAKSIQIPVRISRELLYSLSQSGLITEITVDQPRERLYQPATDIRKLNLSYVLSNLDNYGTKDVPVLKNREYNKIVELIKDFGTKIEEAPSNVLVSDI